MKHGEFKVADAHRVDLNDSLVGSEFVQLDLFEL